jgi:hypothetical protein
MMHIYTRLTAQQYQQGQQHLQQQLPEAQDSGPINLSMSRQNVDNQSMSRQNVEQANVDRTYAELQTVRPGVGVDASDVLRHHNNNDDDANDASVTSPTNGEVLPTTRASHVKSEIVLPNTPSFPDSIIMDSVRPGLNSVSAVPAHIPASGIIGRGALHVSAQYQVNISDQN